MNPRAHAYSVDQIEAMLHARLAELAYRLAPNGKRHGQEWQALNPTRADRKLGSFSINLHTGKWADFAEGKAASSLPCLALIAYCATGGNFINAIKWAKDWLGLTGRDPDPVAAAKANDDALRLRAEREAEEEKRREHRRRLAHSLWLHAKPLDGTDPASRYLAARGIDVTRLPGGAPGALRFNPTLRYYDENGRMTEYPGMVAAMHRQGSPNGFAACHQTYLAEVGGVWGKALGRNSKRILGAKSGASIRLVKGARGTPLSKAEADELVAIGEGIENCLSAAIAKPGLRVLAAATLENIGKVILPEQIRRVVIIADNDALGSAASLALETHAIEPLLDRELDVSIAHPPAGFKDFNDVLLGKRQVAA